MTPSAGFRALACLSFAFLTLTTCRFDSAGPATGRKHRRADRLSPAADPGVFNLVIDTIRLVVVRPSGDTALVRTVGFSADQDRLDLHAGVFMDLPSQQFLVTTQLLNAVGYNLRARVVSNPVIPPVLSANFTITP